MSLKLVIITALVPLLLSSIAFSEEDKRKKVEFPEMMKNHMLGNMRDHLMAINEILIEMGNGELDKAADIAEQRLGMSSLDNHGASHMAKMMPEGMQSVGTSMHKAASRFAIKAQEGDVLATYKSLQEVTATCVACHAGYKVQ